MRLSFSILLCLFCASAIGQQVLYLEQPGRFKRKEIESGQECVWEIDGMQWIPSKLEKVRDTLVFIADDSVALSRITGLKVNRNPHTISMFRKAFFAVTIFYPVMITLNAGVKGLKDRWREVLVVAGSAYLMNHLMRIFYVKRIHLERARYRLIIRDRI